MKDEVEKLRKPIDHSIDVRYAPDLLAAFNRFIKKWCADNYPHLIDSDDNDGEFIRERIAAIETAQVEAVKAARIDELEMMAYDCYFGKTMTTQNEPPRIHYGDSVEADYIQDRLARLEQK